MKPLLTAFLALTGVAMVSTAANSQTPDLCFMQDSSGHVINLSQLCGGSTDSNSLTTHPEVFQAQIKRRQGGTPIIDVTFNGQHTFEMIFDTGASQTTITPPMAAALKLVPVGVEKAKVASGEILEFPVGRVNSLAVGGAVISDSMVSVGPVPLLGQNFFGDYDVTIKQKVVEFRIRH